MALSYRLYKRTFSYLMSAYTNISDAIEPGVVKTYTDVLRF